MAYLHTLPLAQVGEITKYHHNLLDNILRVHRYQDRAEVYIINLICPSEDYIITLFSIGAEDRVLWI